MITSFGAFVGDIEQNEIQCPFLCAVNVIIILDAGALFDISLDCSELRSKLLVFKILFLQVKGPVCVRCM